MTDYLSFDSPDDELRDDEYPDEPEGDDDTDTLTCPNCGAEVYEDAVQCPACREYMTPTEGPLAGRPVWWLVLGFVGIAATLLALGGLLCR